MCFFHYCNSPFWFRLLRCMMMSIVCVYMCTLTFPITCVFALGKFKYLFTSKNVDTNEFINLNDLTISTSFSLFVIVSTPLHPFRFDIETHGTRYTICLLYANKLISLQSIYTSLFFCYAYFAICLYLDFAFCKYV